MVSLELFTTLHLLLPILATVQQNSIQQYSRLYLQQIIFKGFNQTKNMQGEYVVYTENNMCNYCQLDSFLLWTDDTQVTQSYFLGKRLISQMNTRDQIVAIKTNSYVLLPTTALKAKVVLLPDTNNAWIIIDLNNSKELPASEYFGQVYQ
jgi:hypothetical protein